MTTEEHSGLTMTVGVMLWADPELDPETYARLTRRLRAEIDELDVDSVEAASGEHAPPGAKGTDLATVGTLIVALSASGGVLPNLINTVRDWLERQSGNHRVSVTIDGDTIELDRATADQQRNLVDAYIRRHPVG